MALNFPASPNEGDIYEAEGKTFQFLDGGWAVIPSGGSSEVEIAPTPPLNPIEGQTYWDSELGTHFIWYIVVDSAQWVPITPSVAGATGNKGDQGDPGPDVTLEVFEGAYVGHRIIGQTLECWGNDNGDDLVTFPLEFQDIPNVGASSRSGPRALQIENPTTTNFTARVYNTNSGNTTTGNIMWHAIGQVKQ